MADLSYRQLQQKLKIQRSLGNVNRGFLLTQSKAALRAKLNLVKERKDRKIERRRRRYNRPGYFQDNVPKEVKLNSRFTLKNLLETIRYPADRMVLMQKGNVNYTLNRRVVERILENFGTNEDEIYLNQVDLNEIGGSDAELIQTLIEDRNENPTITYIPIKNKRRQEGAFFPYTHNMNIDLSRYQIFSEVLADNYIENCFVHALIVSGKFNDGTISYVKTMCKNSFIPQKDFKTIAQKLKICIRVKRLRSDGDVRWVSYGNTHETVTITLGLLKEHYFLLEKTNITKYAITNYDDVCDREDWSMFTQEGTCVRKRTRSFIDSFEVVRTLLSCADKRLKEIDNCNEIMKSTMHVHVKDNFTTLEYDEEENAREVIYKPKEPKHEHIVYFDFETTTDQKCHVPYLISYTYGDLIKSSRNKYDFLESLKDKTLCYAHNLGYDFRFFISCLYEHRIIQKSATKVIHLVGKYYKKSGEKINIEFKCSYAMTDSPLRNFPKIFGFKDIKKEILPYGVYTSENVLKDKIKISDALKYVENEDQEEFKKNIDDWGLRDGEYYDHMKYSQNYCEQDVRVTKRGFEIFRQWIKKATGLDICNYLTIASVADEYLKKEGCYEGTYELSGIPRRFIQNCLRGGRTMTRRNKMIHVKGKFSDFDGVCLYPSAIERLGGFLLGLPKVITNTDYNDLKTKTSYFVEVNITNVRKKRDFPLINKKMDNGVVKFDNDLRGIFYLDKISLEDLIKYQDIEFEIIKGYYFDEGRNPKSVDTIKYLFNERLKKKNEMVYDESLKREVKGNPIQAVYKLLMNSCYGKTCLKENITDVKIMSESRYKTFLMNNYNRIKDIRTVDSYNRTLYVVNAIKSVNDHFNRCHIGSEILSMSKRIMNEVMCTAEDLSLKIYYQDTDSMHIEFDKITLLSDTFREKYKRNLIGVALGQFHADFSDTHSVQGFKSEKPVYAEESIFLGKKSYIDKLVMFKKKEGHVYEKDVVYPEEEYDKVNDYHIRLKGIPSKVVNAKVKREFGNDPIKLFNRLHKGEDVNFNLLDIGKKSLAPSFEGSRDYTIKSRTEFSRTLVFVEA